MACGGILVSKMPSQVARGFRMFFRLGELSASVGAISGLGSVYRRGPNNWKSVLGPTIL